MRTSVYCGYERDCVWTELQLHNKAFEPLIVLFLICSLWGCFCFSFGQTVSESGHIFHVLCLCSLLGRGSWRAIIVTACRDGRVWTSVCFHICRTVFGPVWHFRKKKLWDIFILMLLFKYEKQLKQLLTTDVFIDLLFDLFDQAKMSNCDDFLLFSV